MSWAAHFRKLKNLATVWVPPSVVEGMHLRSGPVDTQTVRIEIRALPDRGSFSWIIDTFWWTGNKERGIWLDSSQKEAFSIDHAVEIVENEVAARKAAGHTPMVILFIPPLLRRCETWPQYDPDYGM